MAELYLIVHKVRGEPAFDIAERLQIGDEEGWIIPTSGHRAYPYWRENLRDVMISQYNGYILGSPLHENMIPPMPPDWPDHYQTAPSRAEAKSNGANLLSALGLARPAQPVRRI